MIQIDYISIARNLEEIYLILCKSIIRLGCMETLEVVAGIVVRNSQVLC